MERWTMFQLSLLLLAVPAQYIISKYTYSSDAQKSYAIRNLVKGVKQFGQSYLSLQAWRDWCQSFITAASDDDQGESPAIEVMRLNEPHGYFAASPDPRSPRPPNVKYRVGQVIRHKLWGYRGIIIGWDDHAKAPDYWIKQMHGSTKPEWSTQPNYSILVDTRDRLHPQSTYVPEENIEVLEQVQVMHPERDNYFEDFDGAQYLPRPWLRSIYPHD